jgi:hypothetical protein
MSAILDAGRARKIHLKRTRIALLCGGGER